MKISKTLLTTGSLDKIEKKVNEILNEGYQVVSHSIVFKSGLYDNYYIADYIFEKNEV